MQASRKPRPARATQRDSAGFHTVPIRALLASALVFGLTACGTPGPPHPPSLKLPEPATELAANRIADTVSLTWTMPRRTTDKLPLRTPINVKICRSVATQPCVVINNMTADPSAPAAYQDHLPSDLTSGTPQLLIYTIELTNHANHSAGPSQPAYSASGPAPAALTALAAEVRADGVLLRWNPSPAQQSSLVRIHRSSITTEASAQQHKTILSTPNPAASEQILAVPETSGNAEVEGRALDTQAIPDRTYTYTAERVTTLQLSGRTIQIAGTSSDPITVITKDVFPPAVPTGLVALTVPDEHAIDLSWQPDTEPDLAGYIVYRRPSVAGSQPERISAAPVIVPSFRDPAARPGQRYAYSVSAIDHDGNESARSAEAEETLPPG